MAIDHYGEIGSNQRITNHPLSLKNFGSAMAINFDVLVQTPEHSIDMKSGLETFQGASETTRYIAETVLTGRTSQRHSHKNKVRTVLKQSFKGSYGQMFSLEIYDDELQKKFARIGRATFAELMEYFIHEALYLETKENSDKANKIIESLGEDEAEKLVEQLRSSPLNLIHGISKKFNLTVQLRYRKNREIQKSLATLNTSTAQKLEAVRSEQKVDLTACITRLNIYTGNGRLQVKGEHETTAFGFGITYREVRIEAKRIFSDNLNKNNGTPEDKMEYIRISAYPVKLQNDRVVKYIIAGFY
ncbi:hypothetical protein [Pseudomonas hunanensis]|uniref:hypothetical protein n=1 Tax=Pseudomonas hunanensis TaxID=1247546 RepID=UPI002405A037|nr:hypothetical protein [Pseudomonas hunanensis]MDF9756424.1 hypothetical protein [Pseudomonas hunanensis]